MYRYIILVNALLLANCFASNDVNYLDKAPTKKESLKYPVVCWSETRTKPLSLRIHYLQLDLKSKKYQLASLPSGKPADGKPYEAVLDKPGDILARHKALVAVNANAFQNPVNKGDHRWSLGKQVDICGLMAAHSGIISPSENNRTAFWLESSGKPQIGVPKSLKGIKVGVADWNHRNPSLSGQLLKSGAVVIADGGGRHPRTAVGFDRSRRWLTMVVVDGRGAGGSVGVTLYELAQILKQRGCTEAINMDGGGSSIMIASDGESVKTINKPSGRSHRPIPCMLGILKKK